MSNSDQQIVSIGDIDSPAYHFINGVREATSQKFDNTLLLQLASDLNDFLYTTDPTLLNTAGYCIARILTDYQYSELEIEFLTELTELTVNPWFKGNLPSTEMVISEDEILLFLPVIYHNTLSITIGLIKQDTFSEMLERRIEYVDTENQRFNES